MRVARALLVVAIGPAILAHELAHVGVARRWIGDDWLIVLPWLPARVADHLERVAVDPACRQPAVVFEWPTGAGRWALAAVALAPLALGLVLAPLVALAAVALPPLVALIVGCWWAVVALPSLSDLRLLGSRPQRTDPQ